MKKIFIGLLILGLLAGIWVSVLVVEVVQELPRPEQVANFQPVQSTKIYDRTGEVLLYEIHGDQNRVVIPSQDIPQYIKQATVAIEDQSFYQHSGFSVSGFLRALWINISSGGTRRPGGSTITQQLVKNAFLSSEKTLQRKLKEFILAYWTEQHYTKDEILTLYLNQVPYGSNAYGIEAASRLYFGVEAKNLSLAQSAALAAMVQAPSYYSPWGDHKDELLARKNYVLDQMYKMNFIDQEELDRAKGVGLVFLSQNLGSIRAPHFVMMIKDYLEKTYGEEYVQNGGLNVITTLDWNLQEKAEEVVKNGAERNAKLYKGKNASLVAQDPKTGQVLALVGSADYFNEDIDGQFNVATQGKRQPGSSFKPFAYLTAFMEGYTPDTIVFDVPTEFAPNNPSCPIVVNFSNKNTSCFHPQNFDNQFRGPVSLQQALSQSINVPAVKVLYLAGLDSVIQTAQKMGIGTLTDKSRFGLSLVLGGGEVHLIDMVNAYSVFAQNGVKHNQSFILSVTNNQGDQLESYKDVSQKVVDPQPVEEINSILSDVSLRSGLFHSSLNLTVFDGYEVALKTGTTNDYRDAWVMGYTPFLTVGVWAGNSDYTPMQQQGGSILAAVPIWSDFMNGVINSFSPESFPRPEPSLSSQPMLNGQYIIQTENGLQVHSILYYIDKNNPTTSQTQYVPATDPQFYNWEVPVIEWANIHIPNFSSTYNK